MRKVTVSILSGACALGALRAAEAAPIVPLAAENFSYVWDFDGATEAENFDRYDSTTGAQVGDGTFEWNPRPTPVSSVISITDASLTNTFWTTSAAAGSQITTATGYTVEYRLRMDTTTRLLVEQTLPGTTAAATGIFNATNDTLDIYFDLAGIAGGVRATVPADEFFTLRIAGTPDADKAGGLAYTLYVNNELAADDLNAERTTITTRRFFVGDTGSLTSGTLFLDYAAFTPMPFSPVPEPTSLVLLGLGAAAVLRRRR